MRGEVGATGSVGGWLNTLFNPPPAPHKRNHSCLLSKDNCEIECLPASLSLRPNTTDLIIRRHECRSLLSAQAFSKAKKEISGTHSKTTLIKLITTLLSKGADPKLPLLQLK